MIMGPAGLKIVKTVTNDYSSGEPKEKPVFDNTGNLNKKTVSRSNKRFFKSVDVAQSSDKTIEES